MSIDDIRNRIPFEDMTFEYMQEEVRNATSASNAVKRMGYSKSSHFLNKFHARAEELDVELEYAPRTFAPKLTNLGVFCVDSNYSHQTQYVIDRGAREGLLYKECDECVQGPVYNGKPLKFKLYKRNGDFNDLRIENLRVLCPNCYSQVKDGRD